MNLQEEIEKAYKAGFERCLEEAEAPGWNENMPTLPDEFSLDKAVTEYVNKRQLDISVQ